MDHPIPIPFPFPVEDDEGQYAVERAAFWDSPSTREWFCQRGYTLYAHNDVDIHTASFSDPTLSCQPSCKMGFPYAHYESVGGTKTPLRANELTNKVAFAQETQDPSHHVAIKLIVTDSEEHRILQFLRSQGMEILKENCIIPILDILFNGPYSFVVMPRWGSIVYYPEGGPVRNVLHFMHSLLKALAFLHQNNILHRDIKFGNTLVSHFGDDMSLYTRSDARRQLQWSNELSYCLFDFNLSMMLPADTDRAQFRLPYKLSWDGTFYQPLDTLQGEFDYNPFAHDVGNLGWLFCGNYQGLVPHIPLLAPFLDMMVTRNIPGRFTATQALHFFETILPEFPESATTLVFPDASMKSYNIWDRWEGLPADFIQKWEAYREPPLPYSTSIMRLICSFRYMNVIVPNVRLFFFRITLFHSQMRVFVQNLWSLVFR